MTIDPTASTLAAQGVAYAPEIAQAARKHQLDPELLAAVAAQETGGPGSNAGRNVVGDGGHGHGLFQIDDRWHDFAKTPAAMDPGRNADYAAGMLSDLLGRYGGNVDAALSAYNAGSPNAAGTKTTWADGTTMSYAGSVMRHYAGLTNGAGATTGGEVAESAVADLPATVASVGSLGAFAGALPPPSLASTGTQQQQPQSYHRQATDYSDLIDGNADGDTADSPIS
jgi:hypothetical protein